MLQQETHLRSQATSPNNGGRTHPKAVQTLPNLPSLFHLAPRYLTYWVVPALLLGLWQLVTADGIVSTKLLPSPASVLSAAGQLTASGQLLADVAISTQRALIGLALGGSIALVLGLLSGSFPLGERLLDSSIQMLRTIPHLALIPLIILWFGIGESGKVFLIALGVFFPIYLNTFHGVRGVDINLIEMAESYGLSRRQLFLQVIFPGAMPSILVGLRYALGIMWLTLVVAETIAANSGIGFLTSSAREFIRTDILVFAIVLYAVLGKLADIIARLLERLLLAWHPRYNSAVTR